MTNQTDPDLTALLHAQIPFAELLGLRAIAATPAEVRAAGDWRPDRCTSGGVLHGGFLMAAADTVGATCAALNLPSGATNATALSSKARVLTCAHLAQVLDRFLTDLGESITPHPYHTWRWAVCAARRA